MKFPGSNFFRPKKTNPGSPYELGEFTFPDKPVIPRKDADFEASIVAPAGEVVTEPGRFPPQKTNEVEHLELTQKEYDHFAPKEIRPVTWVEDGSAGDPDGWVTAPDGSVRMLENKSAGTQTFTAPACGYASISGTFLMAARVMHLFTLHALFAERVAAAFGLTMAPFLAAHRKGELHPKQAGIFRHRRRTISRKIVVHPLTPRSPAAPNRQRGRRTNGRLGPIVKRSRSGRAIR